MYILIVVVSPVARFPRAQAAHPLNPTWAETQRWLNKSLSDYYDVLVAGYVTVCQQNARVNTWKSFFVHVSNIFVALIMGLILPEAFGIQMDWESLISIAVLAGLIIPGFAARTYVRITSALYPNDPFSR